MVNTMKSPNLAVESPVPSAASSGLVLKVVSLPPSSKRVKSLPT